MKKRLSANYYLIPVVYFLIIILLLFFQFYAKEEFNEKVGNLSISGITSPKALIGGKEIAELKVGFNDLDLLFTRKHPLIAEFEQGSQEKIKIKSFHTFADGVELEFSNNLVLRFNLNGSLGDRITLKPIISDNLSDCHSLSVPFQITKGKAERTIGIPLVKLSSNMGSSYVSLPIGSVIDLENSRLVMNMDQEEIDPTILFERVQKNGLEPYHYWFTRDSPFAGKEEYDKQVGIFLDKAYQNWKRISFSDPDHRLDVETTGTALLSEAIKRGEYRKSLLAFSRELRQIIRSNPDYSLPFLTAAYLGDLPLFLQKQQTRAPGQINRITNLIKQSDFSLFHTPDLIRFILNHAPFSLVEEVIRLADSIDLGTESITVLLGLLETYLEALRWFEHSVTALSRVSDIIDRRLLPAIRRSDQGLFLVSQQEPKGTVDLLESIEAGRLLIRAGEIVVKPAYNSIGRNLILSALQLSDSEGFLPSRCEYQSNRIIPGSFSLAPEKVYMLITDQRYTPEEYPLYRYLYPGIWIWTASRVVQIKIDQNRYRFFFSFPVGEAHYLIIQGVRPFKSLIIHKIIWKQDPQYFRYTDGWYYDESSQTLFVKLTHRIEEEEILINY